jgi:hypothetical protein
MDMKYGVGPGPTDRLRSMDIERSYSRYCMKAIIMKDVLKASVAEP